MQKATPVSLCASVLDESHVDEDQRLQCLDQNVEFMTVNVRRSFALQSERGAGVYGVLRVGRLVLFAC
jgi:hypothetical protein